MITVSSPPKRAMLAAMIGRRVCSKRSLLCRLDPLWQDQQQQILRNFLSWNAD
jgi:hypothetical protein